MEEGEEESGLQTADLSAGQSLTLNLAELDILDDAEFEIPTVEKPPTLESILNEPEDDTLDEEDMAIAAPLPLLKADSGESSSISSVESMETRRKEKLRTPKTIHGSVVKPKKLKSISAQLLSAADRVDAGMPTAIAVSSLVAIGTSHGLVLVFDTRQVLKWCLGSTAVGAQYGAVSALSFNRDCSRLLCGFAKGQVNHHVGFDKWQVDQNITDAHPPGTAVLHVKFTDSFVLAACSDSGGSVFELEFKRLIGVRSCESQCLFSGSRGEVCTIEPLHMNYTIKDHPMQDVMLLAMASLSKVLVVTLRPQLKVMFTHPLKGDPATLPQLAWQFVIIQVSEKDRVIDPVLAFGRDQTIFFYQVICTGPHDIRVSGLQKLQLSYKILSFVWMNARTLVILDKSEKLHVIDVRSEEELEVIDVSDVQLVYSSSCFKSLATGGNVSQALRIDVLVKAGQYHDALALALSFYEGKAKAVVGLPSSHSQRAQIVSHQIIDILFEFVDLSMTKLCPDKGRIEELEDYYQEIVPVCVDYCLHLKKMDILFGRIYDRFAADVIAKGTFLECLEPYIQSDRLTAIPPGVMKDFVDHYEMRGMLDSVESCIVHLDIGSLDIHQVVNLCWSHCLYDAIIYVYTRGMHDYITPLEQLLTRLGDALSTGKQLTGEPAYPYLRTLLQFDTREFLNVLALAFEEAEFNKEEGIQKRQRVVDILLQIMVESIGFSPTQVGILFTFLARQMARHENTIFVNRILFEQVLEFLANPADESRHEERQQALMELIHAGGLAQFDEMRLLRLAENAKFYRVCEFLYEKRREYHNILLCYIKDPSRRYHVFTFINNIVQSQLYTEAEKKQLQEEALRNLEICRKHKVSEATAYLLEKAGDVQGAFGILLQNLQTNLKQVVQVIQGSDKATDVDVLFSKVETELYVVVQLCQRNSGKMDRAAREALWFPLLEAIMAPQRKLKETADKKYLDHLKEMTHHVLNSMMGYIAPPALLQKIIQDPAYNTGKFGEIKELIIGMLENYNYEETLMETCKSLLYHDLYVHLHSLTSAANRGFVPRSEACNLCNSDFTGYVQPSESDPVIVFRCGHCYHEPCLRAVGSIHVLEGEETFVCYLCSSAKRSGRLTSTRFHRSLPDPAQQLRQSYRSKTGAKEMSLDPQHVLAFENIRRSMKTPSRMAILTELAKPERSSSHQKPLSIFQKENFSLRLAPPPPMGFSDVI
ncbi:hypothetical protein C0Q70_01472 [Pomacea canaliculata]|uniref:RING-type domain-containing protein n=1 Tax=Pomacea canaliculata TaxID=400727 RepID=A0A2T7PZK5_POMCA|nr:hypothetical protein C0Q70_01472 [Pomacea canaliculata]